MYAIRSFSQINLIESNRNNFGRGWVVSSSQKDLVCFKSQQTRLG